MSDTTPADTGPTPGATPQLIVNAQYLRDLSFENPRAPGNLVGQKGPPAVSVNVDVKARALQENLFEVILTIRTEATMDNEPAFLIELEYGGVVTVQNADADILPMMILVETPRLLFPFARNIIADATREGGFPPLLINPVDFLDLLRRQQQAAAEQGDAEATSQA
jgi:preprotein translocase subunit SecB